MSINRQKKRVQRGVVTRFFHLIPIGKYKVGWSLLFRFVGQANYNVKVQTFQDIS